MVIIWFESKVFTITGGHLLQLTAMSSFTVSNYAKTCIDFFNEV